MENYIDALVYKMISKGYKNDYIELCKQYATRLIKNNLPVIFDFDHLCVLTDINKSSIGAIINNKDFYYTEVDIAKKSGGIRTLNIPKEKLKTLQRWILEMILNNISISEYATAFRKNYSILNNSILHTNQECVINLDLLDFFPSIHSKDIYRIFRYYGYTKELSSVLANICTTDDSLPQGAPTSPYLANIVCKKLDKRLSSLANANEFNYSRYADDITFSGNKNIRYFLEFITRIIENEGFRINNSKTRIQLRHERQMVTGLVVNEKVSVPSKTLKYLRQEIYYLKKYGVYGHMRERGINKSNYKQHLYGWAYFIKMIDKSKGEKLINELNTVGWDY